MKQEDKFKFAELMTGLGEMFNKECSKILTKMYFESLKNFKIEDVEAGVYKAMTNLKFFPKPVEIIECINGGQAAIEDNAQIQASKVLKAIKKYGAYSSVCFDDAITNTVIRNSFGGWVKLCSELLTDEEKWFYKDFIKAYTAFKRQGFVENGHLAGRHEIGNNSIGNTKEILEIFFIGDETKAMQIAHAAEDETKKLLSGIGLLTERIGEHEPAIN